MKLASFVDKFKDKKVVIVGDLMVDEYFAGRVSRISPEAPVPLVDVEKHFFVCGGAANVAANIASLGGVPLVSGVVGKDHAASQLHWLLKTRGISASGVFLESGRSTTIKTRVIAHSQQVVRFDQENRHSISQKTEKNIVSFIEKNVPKADAAIVSDYDKGVVTPLVAKSLLSVCRENGIPTVPHVVVGIHYGKLKGEKPAVEIVSKHNPAAVVIVALTPLRNTKMEHMSPPSPLDIARVILASRLLMPETPLLLGCARPKGQHKVETDILAIKAGVNGIAYPTEEALGFAEELGLKVKFYEKCCSLVWQDESRDGLHERMTRPFR